MFQLYSGYYKHTVERQLKNAQVVLQLMGYEKKEEGVLQLTRAVDAATLSDVALDCLIASAECQASALVCTSSLLLSLLSSAHQHS